MRSDKNDTLRLHLINEQGSDKLTLVDIEQALAAFFRFSSSVTLGSSNPVRMLRGSERRRDRDGQYLSTMQPRRCDELIAETEYIKGDLAFH